MRQTLTKPPVLFVLDHSSAQARDDRRDRAALADLAAGKSEALADLYDRHAVPLVRHAMALVSHPLAWTDRIWFSRCWRISLTAATAGAALLVYMSGPSAPFDPAIPAERASVTAIEETMQDAGLRPEEAPAIARRTVNESWPPASAMYPSALQVLESLETIGGRQ